MRLTFFVADVVEGGNDYLAPEALHAVEVDVEGRALLLRPVEGGEIKFGESIVAIKDARSMPSSPIGKRIIRIFLVSIMSLMLVLPLKDFGWPMMLRMVGSTSKEKARAEVLPVT